MASAIFSEHLPHVTLPARPWGSRVSKRDPNPPSQWTRSPLTCPARSCSRDLPNVFKSLGTSFSALGSHLFGIWNVLFWFWVKPQEKDFYFWNAHFQLYIPLDGIRFSGMEFVQMEFWVMFPVLLWKRVLFEREGDGLVRQQHWLSSYAVCSGCVRKRVFPKTSGTQSPDFLTCFSGQEPNGNNRHFPIFQTLR